MKVSFVCPAMKIEAVGIRLRRTDPEPMTFTAQMPDGTTLTIGPVTIAPTDVKPVRWPLKWRVDACDASANDEHGNYVSVKLPAEDVAVHLIELCAIAAEIAAETELILANGQHWTGQVVFPACRVPFVTGAAEPVTATGELALTTPATGVG